MAIDRFDVRDYTGMLQREKKFDLFRKGQAKRATGWLTEMLEDFYKKQMKTFEGRVKPWQQTLIKVGGNIIAPGVGSLLSGLTQAYNTIHTHKDYADLIKEVGKKIEIPKWAKGTFMEDYLTTNLLGGQATAKNILAGSQKSSDLSGGVGALLDFISAGKGFAKTAELRDKAYDVKPVKNIQTGKVKAKEVAAGTDFDTFGSDPISISGYRSKVNPKLLGMIPGAGIIQEATNPIIDLAGKMGVGGRTGDFFSKRPVNLPGVADFISELSTPSSWSQYAHKPLIEMLLGPEQETYVPELRTGDYRIRRR